MALSSKRNIFGSKFSRRSAAPNHMCVYTQGSQSLALGLVVTAAPQLAPSSRLEGTFNDSRPQGAAESRMILGLTPQALCCRALRALTIITHCC